jgi:hypothetical protein
MMNSEQIDRASLARREVSGAELGDARLSARLERVSETLARNPGKSLPDAFEDSAGLEATYRFLGNERIGPDAILAPHVANTLERCSMAGLVLAIFDTSELRFGGEREGLGYLSHMKGRGMLAHLGLAVEAETDKALGVIHSETIVRRGEYKKRKEALGAEDSESNRWLRGVQTAASIVPNAVCVMDREGDIFPLLSTMDGRGQRFVVRAAHNRNTDAGPLWDLVDSAPLLMTREFEVSERRLRKRKNEAKRHPPRSQHSAKLEVRVCEVLLPKPRSTTKRALQGAPASVVLNAIYLIERDPPLGDAPIEWLLLTNLPVTTEEEATTVIKAYRTRWVIEEFFKALKTGCALEKRQLESVKSVSNMLAVSLPIAWLILHLRHLSRTTPDAPATDVLSEPMMRCLRLLLLKRTRRELPAQPTCKDVTWAIAALGGHLRNNGEPGFIVLGRGLEKLLAATEVVELLQAGQM